MIGLYVHIPFCQKKCHYCDFLSFAATRETQQLYVDALINEMKLYSRSGQLRLASLYLGGGTPTLLDADLLSYLTENILKYVQFDDDIEATVEANPGTLTLEKAKILKDVGFNRISLGVQSLNDEELRLMGRIHTALDVSHSVEILHRIGFTNYSFDFIGGLPGQDTSKLLSSLKKAVKLEPKHISLYGLKIEEDSAWGKLYEEDKLVLPNEDLSLELMKTAQAYLKGEGFVRYEISNYAKAGYQSKHNLRYWLNEEYIGLGLGAASYLAGERLSNEQEMEKYLQKIKKQVFPVEFREKIHKDLEQSETVILALRLIEGLKRSRFMTRFNKDVLDIYPKAIEKHRTIGTLNLTSENLSLTARGLEVANEVMQDFLP